MTPEDVPKEEWAASAEPAGAEAAWRTSASLEDIGVLCCSTTAARYAGCSGLAPTDQ
jgi:hypothetical protein